MKADKKYLDKDQYYATNKVSYSKFQVNETLPGDGTKQITIKYHRKKTQHIVDPAELSNADIMRVSESLNFNVVDMYTGRTLYLEDGSLNGDSEIEWGVNNWKFNCQSEENRAEQKWSDWSWTGDGYPYIEMYDESDVSIIITCPEDYDGLCLVGPNLTIYKRNDPVAKWVQEDGTVNFEIPEEESGQIFDEEEKDTNNSFFKNHTPDEYYIYHIYDLIKE